MQFWLISGTYGLACQCLASKSEAVHKIAEESEELHEKCIYCKFDIAETCACGDKEIGKIANGETETA